MSSSRNKNKNSDRNKNTFRRHIHRSLINEWPARGRGFYGAMNNVKHSGYNESLSALLTGFFFHPCRIVSSRESLSPSLQRARLEPTGKSYEAKNRSMGTSSEKRSHCRWTRGRTFRITKFTAENEWTLFVFLFVRGQLALPWPELAGVCAVDVAPDSGLLGSATGIH